MAHKMGTKEKAAILKAIDTFCTEYANNGEGGKREGASRSLWVKATKNGASITQSEMWGVVMKGEGADEHFRIAKETLAVHKLASRQEKIAAAAAQKSPALAAKAKLQKRTGGFPLPWEEGALDNAKLEELAARGEKLYTITEAKAARITGDDYDIVDNMAQQLRGLPGALRSLSGTFMTYNQAAARLTALQNELDILATESHTKVRVAGLKVLQGEVASYQQEVAAFLENAGLGAVVEEVQNSKGQHARSANPSTYFGKPSHPQGRK